MDSYKPSRTASFKREADRPLFSGACSALLSCNLEQLFPWLFQDWLRRTYMACKGDIGLTPAGNYEQTLQPSQMPVRSVIRSLRDSSPCPPGSARCHLPLPTPHAQSALSNGGPHPKGVPPVRDIESILRQHILKGLRVIPFHRVGCVLPAE